MAPQTSSRLTGENAAGAVPWKLLQRTSRLLGFSHTGADIENYRRWSGGNRGRYCPTCDGLQRVVRTYQARRARGPLVQSQKSQRVQSFRELHSCSNTQARPCQLAN